MCGSGVDELTRSGPGGTTEGRGGVVQEAVCGLVLGAVKAGMPLRAPGRCLGGPSRAGVALEYPQTI